ncbi:MAG: hypothetical protein NC453_13135 [Muribaculum sp.]|nr:hypothetical protein [Muribaculum sp.]
MEQAENFEQLIKRIAEELTMADHVYYDLDSLKYGVMFEDWLSEYGEYLDLNDEAFNATPEDELGGWQREQAEDVRKVLDLPHCIDKPFSSESFHWMEEFTETHANNQKFFRDAVKALRNRHPFRGFRAALDWNGLTDEWYPFRDTKMQDYVRKEIEPINEDDIE